MTLGWKKLPGTLWTYMRRVKRLSAHLKPPHQRKVELPWVSVQSRLQWSRTCLTFENVLKILNSCTVPLLGGSETVNRCNLVKQKSEASTRTSFCKPYTGSFWRHMLDIRCRQGRAWLCLCSGVMIPAEACYSSHHCCLHQGRDFPSNPYPPPWHRLSQHHRPQLRGTEYKLP